MVSKLLEMKEIHKWFGKVYALKGVSFSVYPGEVVGLIGDNGAGKSTLIKILTGVLKADKGEIFFQGKKCKFFSPKEARAAGIETIYQEQSLAGDLSVTRNIFLGKEFLKKRMFLKLLDHEKMKKTSIELLSKLGLNLPSVDNEARFCSGGEQQGIAIARAMYFKAKLVILDEPTRALGVAGVRRVLELVKELKSRGIASIFITHNLHHVYPIADRFVVLVRGKKVGDSLKKDTSINKLTTLMIKK